VKSTVITILDSWNIGYTDIPKTKNIAYPAISVRLSFSVIITYLYTVYVYREIINMKLATRKRLCWLQENGFARLKRISEGKKSFVIPKLRNAVASNSYLGWGI
jgi:hypothetical protein